MFCLASVFAAGGVAIPALAEPAAVPALVAAGRLKALRATPAAREIQPIGDADPADKPGFRFAVTPGVELVASAGKGEIRGEWAGRRAESLGGGGRTTRAARLGLSMQW